MDQVKRNKCDTRFVMVSVVFPNESEAYLYNTCMLGVIAFHWSCIYLKVLLCRADCMRECSKEILMALRLLSEMQAQELESIVTF